MSFDYEKTWTDFKVGVLTFVAAFLLVAGVTFAGGNKGILFQETSTITTLLPDVGGLKEGSSVSMGGMTIGKVIKVSFAPDPGSTKIEVVSEIKAAVRNRIKSDSVPMVRTQGMMGDRYLDISVGTPNAESLPANAVLQGSETSDFDTTLKQATATLTEAQKLLIAINEKTGSAGQFVYDERFYENLSNVTQELNDLIKDFKKKPSKYINLSMF